MNRWEK